MIPAEQVLWLVQLWRWSNLNLNKSWLSAKMYPSTPKNQNQIKLKIAKSVLSVSSIAIPQSIAPPTHISSLIFKIYPIRLLTIVENLDTICLIQSTQQISNFFIVCLIFLLHILLLTDFQFFYCVVQLQQYVYLRCDVNNKYHLHDSFLSFELNLRWHTL